MKTLAHVAYNYMNEGGFWDDEDERIRNKYEKMTRIIELEVLKGFIEYAKNTPDGPMIIHCLKKYGKGEV